MKPALLTFLLIFVVLMMAVSVSILKGQPQSGTVVVPSGSHWGLLKDSATEQFRLPAGLNICLDPKYTLLEKPLKFTVAPYTTTAPAADAACTPIPQELVDKLNARIQAIKDQQK